VGCEEGARRPFRPRPCALESPTSYQYQPEILPVRGSLQGISLMGKGASRRERGRGRRVRPPNSRPGSRCATIGHSMSDSSTTTTKDDSPLAKAAAESSRLSAGAADMSRFHYRMFKRGLDISVAGFLLLLSPVWLLPLAILIKLDSRGPVFFKHSRIGRGGKAFDVLKFRTMVQDAERILKSDKELQAQFEEGFKIKDDPRVTRMGKLFRKLSLDELPQIINIFRGQMSFVGPRPIVESERYKYGDRFENLTTVKPGPLANQRPHRHIVRGTRRPRHGLHRETIALVRYEAHAQDDLGHGRAPGRLLISPQPEQPHRNSIEGSPWPVSPRFFKGA
jgi:lipopolysaccharide/colanic/teichoic acid biosynthesis glycosyltransferase